MRQSRNLLAFAASYSSSSINRQLVRHALHLLPDWDQELLDLNDYEMPIYSADREKADGPPPEAQRFLENIAAADALLISFEEHNGSYTAAFKNLFDWASRIKTGVWQGKPMIVLSTSPGRRGAARVMRTVVEAAARYDGVVLASMSLPSFSENFDSDRGEIDDPALRRQLDQTLSTLRE